MAKTETATKAAAAGKTPKPVFDRDAEGTVFDAIHAFYRIRRLAFRALDDSDAESFCMAITEISQLHGKALDDCAMRLSGHGVGCFDKEHIDREETAD
jgi:hypothetical protein